ncbi:MAG: discoidin domain-containing protein, partial [Phycisphaerae bacterium]|nr:discoidin domain-containing protein [Phycisphaerae bacterium]
ASGAAVGADSPWLYGIHWYGDANGSSVEVMTGDKGIWSLETVMTNSDVWWGAEWQRDNRFSQMAARGHTLIVRLERNWGETVPYPGNLEQYLVDVQAAASSLAGVCHIWQIGNEMNLYGEWGGNELTAAAYIDMFNQIRSAIQAVPSPLGPQIVLLGPVSPGDVVSGVRHTEGNEYLSQVCALLAADDVDGFALHAYAAPWNDADTSRAEFQAGYLSQLAVIDHHGFAAKRVHLTEWNRRVDPIDDYNEAQSARFLHGALTDLDAWNQRAGAHPIGSACWFIYQYDSGAWSNYSIEYLRGTGPSGADQDLWDALQYACTLNLPAAYSAPPATPLMQDAMPSGTNAAPQSLAVWTDSGDGSYAIDGVISAGSKWTSDGTTPPHWLQLDLGQERVVTGFVVRHAGAGGEPSYYNTRTFHLEMAPTAAGPWAVDATVFNVAGVNSTMRTYLAPRAVRHVRLFITDPGIDTYARIPEFEVYVQAPPGDFNSDGVVTWADFAMFRFCMKGPDDSFSAGHTCLIGDADGDADVDLADFASIQEALQS